MQDNLEILERNQRQHLSKVRPEEYEQWKGLPMTKAFLLQFKIDLEDLMEQWVNGVFSEKDQYKAQGCSAYLYNMLEDLDEFVGRAVEKEDA